MERESKKQKLDTDEKEEKKPWPEYYTEPAEPTYRTPPFEYASTNNFGGISIHSQYAKEDWKRVDLPYSGSGRYRRVLQNIRKRIDKRSTSYTQGWSPLENGSTEAFFRNFQAKYIKWSELWPNTRIPLAEPTPESHLEHCCIIEVDLEDIEETVVEHKKQKFREVNLTLRHDQDLVDFRHRTNVDIYPLLPIIGTPLKIIGNHDQNSYTGFYRILL
jgi:hypothetical protein